VGSEAPRRTGRDWLLYVSLGANAILLAVVIVVLLIGRAADLATPAAGAPPTEGESASRAAAAEPTPSAPSGVAPTEATDTGGGSAQVGGSPVEGVSEQGPNAPDATTPPCFDHFEDTRPTVPSRTWVYLTVDEAQVLYPVGPSVVVLVEDYQVIGGIRLRYDALGGGAHVYDALDSGCDLVQATIEETEDRDRYIAVEVHGGAYRVFLDRRDAYRMLRLEAS
jgi:hypothetical protein